MKKLFAILAVVALFAPPVWALDGEIISTHKVRVGSTSIDVPTVRKSDGEVCAGYVQTVRLLDPASDRYEVIVGYHCPN